MSAIPKQESKHKARLKPLVEALPGFLVYPLVDSSNGLPDWLIVGNGVMSMLEFKHATPAFSSRGIQVLTARRIAAAGRCRYVVFWENLAGAKRTCVVHPRDVQFGHNASTVEESFAPGHDYAFVVDYVRKVHGL